MQGKNRVDGREYGARRKNVWYFGFLDEIRVTQWSIFVNIVGGDNLNFSERLTKLMAEKRESNYRLAKELGVHQTTIANWKSGVTPQLAHAGKLADHFGISIDDLLMEDT